MQRTLKVVLFGAGFLARTRARCWARVHGFSATVVVAARDRQKAVNFAREHGLAGGCTIDEALADPTVDLVDLCVPNRAHRELAERAFAAGKHVLCTKPLTAYWGQGLPADAGAGEVAAVPRPTMLARAVADAQAMVDAAARAGRKLFYGENWLYAPSIRRAMQLAAASRGVAMEMRGWESHSGSHSPYAKDWRFAGGGALLRLGAHPIGAMLAWKRSEGLRLRGTPTRVVAVTAEVADVTAAVRTTGAACDVGVDWNGVENWGTCVLHFDDGSRGVAYGSDTLLGGMQSHLTVLGSAYRFECALSPVDSLRAYAVRDGAFGGEYLMEKLHGQAGWSTPMAEEDRESGQLGLVQGVGEAVVGGGAGGGGGLDGAACGGDGVLGLEVVKVVYAGYVSAVEGRRVGV